MIGPAEAVEIPTNQRPTKRVSFYEFLATYRSPLACGDEISDLGADVERDAKAPRANARLIDYLLHRRGVDGRLIERALEQWKEARNG